VYEKKGGEEGTKKREGFARIFYAIIREKKNTKNKTINDQWGKGVLERRGESTMGN